MRAILGGAPDYKKVSFAMVWAPPHVTRASEGRMPDGADMAAFSCAGEKNSNAGPSVRVFFTVLRCGQCESEQSSVCDAASAERTEQKRMTRTDMLKKGHSVAYARA